MQAAESQCYLNLLYRMQSPLLDKDKCEWENTALCRSDNTNPKIMASEIHEWLNDQLHIDENVNTVHVDDLKRQV